MIPDWVARYTALEYDEDRLDCWELARQVLRDQWGIDLPSYREERGGPGSDAWAIAVHAVEWAPVQYADARPGDVVVFRIYGLPAHIGVVIAPSTFLHVEKGSNVTLERWDVSRWRSRVLGLYRHPAMVAAAWAT